MLYGGWQRAGQRRHAHARLITRSATFACRLAAGDDSGAEVPDGEFVPFVVSRWVNMFYCSTL